MEVMTVKPRPETWGGITQGKLRKQRPRRWRNGGGHSLCKCLEGIETVGYWGKKITGQFGVAGTSIMLQVWPSFHISLLVNDMTIFPVTQGILLFASWKSNKSSPFFWEPCKWASSSPSPPSLPELAVTVFLLTLLLLSCLSSCGDLHHWHRARSRRWTAPSLSPPTNTHGPPD